MIRQAAPQTNDKVNHKVLEILKSGQYVKGPEAEKLEQKFSQINGCKYNISCNSGTSALNLIFFAMDYPDNAEIIIPANSFMASSNAVETAGYTSVFCDIDPETMNLDPDKLEAAITDRTAAILVVHLYGTPAPMDEIMQIANKYNLDVFEDAAQAHNATYKGKKIGSMGKASAFSLFPTKNLSVLGDGGIVSTNDKKLGEKLAALRNAGRTDKADDAEYFGFNFRLSEILAGIGNALMDDFIKDTERRKEIATTYSKGLKGIGDLVLPTVIEGTEAVWHQYTIRTSQRDKLKQYLRDHDIQSSIKYSIPLPFVKVYREKYNHQEGDFPVAEKASKELLCLPMHPFLTDNEIETVITTIKDFYQN